MTKIIVILAISLLAIAIFLLCGLGNHGRPVMLERVAAPTPASRAVSPTATAIKRPAVCYIVKGDPIMANIKYALFGATGSVGKALAANLAERDQPFRVVGRSEERLRQDFRAYEPFVEYCAADLSDRVAAARAAAGVDTIFYTVGVPYPQFEQHPKLTRVALEATAPA